MTSPPTPDPSIGSELVKVAFPPGAGLAAKAAARIMGPVWDRYAARHAVDWTLDQLQRELDGLDRAMAMLEASKHPFKPLSAKSAFALLRGLEVEDDPDLRERWSALIANAAIGSEDLTVGFAHVLGQLSAQQARLLDVARRTLRQLPERIRSETFYRRSAWITDAGLPENVGLIHIDALRRHSLINGDNATYLGRVDPFHAMQLSPYGWAFVEACLPPGVVEPVESLTLAEVMHDHGRFHMPESAQSELEQQERDIANDARGA